MPDPVGSAIRVVELKETLIELEASAALDALRTVAHPDGVDELLAALGADLERRDEVAPAGMKLRVAVIESMLVAESDDASSVALWVMQVVTGAGTTRVVYNTLRYDLGLVDGQWLLVHESSSAGPVPTPTQEPTDPTAFESSLTGFTDPIDDRAG